VLPTGKFVWLRVESVSLIDKLYPSFHLQSCFWCMRNFFCTLRDTFNLSATLFGPSATPFGLSATIFYLSATLSNHLRHFQPISIHFSRHLSYIYCAKFVLILPRMMYLTQIRSFTSIGGTTLCNYDTNNFCTDCPP